MRISALLLALLLASLAAAQETINVHVVEVPVTVVDGTGNPVRGLTAKNFELYDGRDKQTLTAFDVIDFASKESVSATSPLNPTARRNILLLFDLSFSSPKGLVRAQDAARDFLAKGLQPRDLAAVGTIEAEKGFNLLTAFTTDRGLLRDAIAAPSTFRGMDPLQIAGKSIVETGLAENAGMLRSDPGEAEMKEKNALVTRRDDTYLRNRIERQVNALSTLARTLGAVRGPKQIVLLSEGFDPRIIIGRDARDSAAINAENEAIRHGAVHTVDSDSRFGSTSSINLVEQMAQYFRGSDVILNAIDIRGVRVQGDVQFGSAINSNDGLKLIARQTGGTVFENANNLAEDFQRMMHAQEVVYVLAFRARSAGTGKFHDLKVKLVDVPGSPRVFSRAGYYDAAAPTAVERTLTTAEIVMNDIPQNDVPVTAWSASFPGSDGNAQVPVILEINGPALLKAAKGASAGAQIYVYAFDQDGIVRDRLYQNVTLDLGKVGDKLRAGGMKYYGTLSLPPGTYAVKSLVRAGDTDLRGYARANVVVPNGRQLALEQPVFMQEGSPSWVMVKGTSHDKGNAYPFEIGGQMFVPTTRAASRFTFLVWNANPGELTWTTTPPAKLVGEVRSGSATKLVFQIDKVDPSATTLDVTVQKKGTPDALKTTVAIPR